MVEKLEPYTLPLTAHQYGEWETIIEDANGYRVADRLNRQWAEATVRLWNTRPRESAIKAENERLREGLNGVLTGGNHLALHIGTDHPPHTATFEEALKHYGPGIHYDIWCCWKNIMDARALLKDKP